MGLEGILPFEEEIFQRVGGNAVYVGHPLMEQPKEKGSREEFSWAHGLDPDKPLLALFPGSRMQEIRRHWEVFSETGRRIQRERPEVQLAVAKAPSIPAEVLPGDGITLVEDGDALLRNATAALVKSGTTTLQAALAGTPFVTVYRTHPLTFFLAKRLVRVPHIALANLVAGERVVPEVLQGDATPEHLAALLAPLLVPGSTARETMLSGLQRVRETLGSPGASVRVAGLAAEILKGRESIPEPLGLGS